MKPVLKPSPTPTPTPKPSKTPEPTNTPVPTPTIIPKATPTPRPNGTCPKLTQIPTNTPVGVIGGGNNGNSGNGGYSSYSSGYQGGYTAGSSKTGESRPFKTMAGLSILGILLLGTGILVFRRSKTGKREKHL